MSRILPKPPNFSPTIAKTSWLQHQFPWLYAFWKFSRAHTIIGTSLSVLGLYAIVLANTPPSTPDAGNLSPFSLVVTLLACLCGNVYIVGLNQLEDVEIDRINKPHLPLASGEFSRREGEWIVAITGVLAIALALWQGVYLFVMVATSLLIGTAYSLPPLRLKRFPFWASLCIFTVRGLIVNLGLYLHFSQGAAILPGVWALSSFVLVFTFAIAIFKDMPDAEGDRQYNISTLTLRLGQKAVFDLSRWVLTASVNLKEKRSISRFYQFIWKLFFLEYIVFAIACWLQ